MSLDRIKQTVPVVGTGPIVLTADPAPGGYKPFIRGLISGQIVVITIVDQITYEFEVTGAAFALGGVGGTLLRAGPISSSNNDQAVNFGGNACDVFVTYTAIVDATSAAIAAALTGLPTAPPLAGGLWNDGGVLSIA